MRCTYCNWDHFYRTLARNPNRNIWDRSTPITSSIIAPTKRDAVHRRGYSVHVRQKLVDVTNYAISKDRSKRKGGRGVLRNVFITDISPAFPLEIMAGRGWRETNNTHRASITLTVGSLLDCHQGNAKSERRKSRRGEISCRLSCMVASSVFRVSSTKHATTRRSDEFFP